MRKPRLDEDQGVAMGRSSVARSRWPDAQIEVTVGREKRKKRREKREEKWFDHRKARW